MKSNFTISLDFRSYIDIRISLRKNFKKELLAARESYNIFKTDSILKNLWKRHLDCAKFYKQILQNL